MEPKTRIGVSKNFGVQFLNSPADLDDLCRLQPLGPEEGSSNKPLGSREVNRGDVHAYL